MQQVALKEYSQLFNLTFIYFYLKNNHNMGHLIEFNTLWKGLAVMSLKVST